jgi:hypothetical protein
MPVGGRMDIRFSAVQGVSRSLESGRRRLDQVPGGHEGGEDVVGWPSRFWRTLSGGLRYHNYPNALAWRPYPQKIAIGSRSISRSRLLMSGDGSSWSYRWKRRLRSRQYNVHILVAWV